jgi:hypothetical protein
MPMVLRAAPYHRDDPPRRGDGKVAGGSSRERRTTGRKSATEARTPEGCSRRAARARTLHKTEEVTFDEKYLWRLVLHPSGVRLFFTLGRSGGAPPLAATTGYPPAAPPGRLEARAQRQSGDTNYQRGVRSGRTARGAAGVETTPNAKNRSRSRARVPTVSPKRGTSAEPARSLAFPPAHPLGTTG